MQDALATTPALTMLGFVMLALLVLAVVDDDARR